MTTKLTISVIKADVSGFVGHYRMHPELVAEPMRHIEATKRDGRIIDAHVTACGHDLGLIMTHTILDPATRTDRRQVHRQRRPGMHCAGAGRVPGGG
ncbi:MAG: hypothetical protein RLZZ387_935 [Chloroflexota bacterium]